MMIAVLMALPLFAKGAGNGLTQADAIDFDWDKGNVHDYPATDARWYCVPLDLLYEQEDPALALYLTNLTRETASVHMEAEAVGTRETKDYTIEGRKNKQWTTDKVAALVRMKQKEIYILLKASKKIALSARVFESVDLDESCNNNLPFDWSTGITQTAGAGQWYQINLTRAKNPTSKFDYRVKVSNLGSGTLTLTASQSFDCPSSAVTKRVHTIAAGDAIYDTISKSMITAVTSDFMYVNIENNQTVKIEIDSFPQPAIPVIDDVTEAKELRVINQPNDTFITAVPVGKTLYKLIMDSVRNRKYEPEFTFLNETGITATVTRKLAYERPAYSVTTSTISLESGEENAAIEVIKKNVIDGSSFDSLFIEIETDQPIRIISRMKHVREGKACKTNIDFNWNIGHHQAKTITQWYAIDVTEAKARQRDIAVKIANEGSATAKVNADMAFSCPYIDLQSISHNIAVGDTLKKTLAYSTYAMMSNVIYIGVTSSQPIYFRADTIPTKPKAVVDTLCLHARKFDWTNGNVQPADTAIWYEIDMTPVFRDTTLFPIAYINNQGTATATVKGEVSLECPDSIENQSRTAKVETTSPWEYEISRNLLANIKDTILYLCVSSNQPIHFGIRRGAEKEGSNCGVAINFNRVAGHDQKAKENPWYQVDVRDAMAADPAKKLVVTIKNKESKKDSVLFLKQYTCEREIIPDTALIVLPANATVRDTLESSTWNLLSDSVIYIQLLSQNALHISVDTVSPKAEEAIVIPPTVVVNDFTWSTNYSLNAGDTVWYKISTAVLHADDEKTPVITIQDKSGAKNTAKLDIFFKMPAYSPLSKTYTVNANETLTKAVEYNTWQGYLRNDSLILRMVATGKCDFRADLVEAYDGHDRTHAVRTSQYLDLSAAAIAGSKPVFSMDIDPTSYMVWYRIETDSFKLPDLHGRSLTISTYNVGAGDATMELQVYNGNSTDDMLEGRGKRTVSRKGRTQSGPAYVVYGIASKTIYICAKSNQPLQLRATLGNYPKLAVPEELCDSAVLVNPNVDYYIPVGTTWYEICLPQIRNTWKLTDSTMVLVENTSSSNIKVTTTSTWQCPLEYKLPERSRTESANYSSRKSLKAWIAKALEHKVDTAQKGKDINHSVEEMSSEYVYDLLLDFITSDSLTAYVCVKADKPGLHFRIDAERIDVPYGSTGKVAIGSKPCAPINFDWEHGHMQPAREYNNTDVNYWYKVALDPNFIPDTCDVKLHVDNVVTTDSTHITAELFFDCGDAESGQTPMRTLNFDILKDSSIVIDKDLIDTLHIEQISMKYSSNHDTHIWVELIPALPGDTIRDTTMVFWCDSVRYSAANGADPISSYHSDTLIYSGVTRIYEWYDTTWIRKGTSWCDSIMYFRIIPVVRPMALTQNVMDSIGALPVVAEGMPIFVTDAAKDTLINYYKKLYYDATDTVDQWSDSIKMVSLVEWQLEVGGKWIALDSMLTDSVLERNHATPVHMRYVLDIECDSVFVPFTEVSLIPEKWQVNYDTIPGTHCADAITHVGVWNIYGDTIAHDSVANVIRNDADTYLRNRLVDSVHVYYLLTTPDLEDESIEYTTKPIAEADSVIKFDAAKMDISAAVSNYNSGAAANKQKTLDITTLDWQWINAAGDTVKYNNEVISNSGPDSLYMRFVIKTECGDSLFSKMDTIVVVKHDSVRIDSIVCNDAFTWYEHSIPLTHPWIDSPIDHDTVWVHKDSILNLTMVQATIFDDTIVHVCKNEAYTWYRDNQEYYGDGSAVLRPAASGNIKYKRLNPSLTCDSIQYRITVYEYPEKVDSTFAPVFVCHSEAKYYWAVTDSSYTLVDGVNNIQDTLKGASLVHGCDSIVKISVTRLIARDSIPQADTTLVDCGTNDVSYVWNYGAGLSKTITIEAAKSDTMLRDTLHFVDKADCDSVIYTQYVKVRHLPLIISDAKDTAVCEGNSIKWRDDKTYIINKDTILTYSIKYAGATCDSAIYTRNVKVDSLKVVDDPTAVAYVCDGDPYTWHGQSYSSVTTDMILHDTVRYAVSGCDSAYYTLNLKVLSLKVPDAPKDSSICADKATNFSWRGRLFTFTKDTILHDTVRYVALPCDSAYYTLRVFIYNTAVTPLPATMTANVDAKLVAVCGQALDIAAANVELRDSLDKNPHFGPSATINWAVLDIENNTWVAPAAYTLNGHNATVSFRYSVTTMPCGDVVHHVASMPIASPAAKTTQLHGKFGHWLLMIHRDSLENKTGNVQTIAEEDVVWYSWDGVPGSTPTVVQVGGYYMTAEDQLVGRFFAEIHATTLNDGCDQKIVSDTIDWSTPLGAPMRLVPNALHSGNAMRLENIDSESESVLRAYDASGNLTWQMTTSGKTEVELHPQGAPGIYLLRVESDDRKETLRYIIK